MHATALPALDEASQPSRRRYPALPPALAAAMRVALNAPAEEAS